MPGKSRITRKEKMNQPVVRRPIYCRLERVDDPYPRNLIPVFIDIGQAKNFLVNVMGNDEWEWKKPKQGMKDKYIETSSGIIISGIPSLNGKDLEEIMAFDIDPDPSIYSKAINVFKYGRHEALPPKEDPQEVQAKKREAKKVKKAKRPKIDTSGMVTANEIAKKLDRLGREVRAVLRSEKLNKPDHGWAWPKDEAKGIEKIIAKGLKKADEKKRKKK